MNFSNSEIRAELANFGYVNLPPKQFEMFKRQLLSLIDSEERKNEKDASDLCKEQGNSKVIAAHKPSTFSLYEMQSLRDQDHRDLDKNANTENIEQTISITDNLQVLMDTLDKSKIHNDTSAHSKNGDDSFCNTIDLKNSYFSETISYLSVNTNKSNDSRVSSKNNCTTNMQEHVHSGIDEILVFQPKSKPVVVYSCQGENRSNSKTETDPETPMIKTHGTKTPGIKTPSKRTPDNKASGFRTPGILSSDHQTHDIQTLSVKKENGGKNKPEDPTGDNWLTIPSKHVGYPGDSITKSTCVYRFSNTKRMDESIPDSLIGNAFDIYAAAKNSQLCEQGTSSFKSKETSTLRSKYARRDTTKRGFKKFNPKPLLPPNERRPKTPSGEHLLKKYYHKFWNAYPLPGEESDAVRVATRLKLRKRFEIKKQEKCYVPNIYLRPHEMDRRSLSEAIKKAHQKYEMPKHGFYHPIKDDQENK